MYPNKIRERVQFPTYNDDIAGFREETDFCLRAKKKGFKVWFVPDAVAWHLLAPHGGTRPHWLKYKEEGKKEADRRFVIEMRRLYGKQSNNISKRRSRKV